MAERDKALAKSHFFLNLAVALVSIGVFTPFVSVALAGKEQIAVNLYSTLVCAAVALCLYFGGMNESHRS
jgi:hypothetical protein